jgi:hypothetical protein
MTAHKHAEFWQHIAEGGDCREWEMSNKDDVTWFTVGSQDLDVIYEYPDSFELRRKPKSSRERFEEKYPKECYSGHIHDELWSAWQEAERQALALAGGEK